MAKFEIVPVFGGGFRWRLKDDADKVLARGGTLYATPAAARSDIEALRGCANTPVVDTTTEGDET